MRLAIRTVAAVAGVALALSAGDARADHCKPGAVCAVTTLLPGETAEEAAYGMAMFTMHDCIVRAGFPSAAALRMAAGAMFKAARDGAAARNAQYRVELNRPDRPQVTCEFVVPAR